MLGQEFREEIIFLWRAGDGDWHPARNHDMNLSCILNNQFLVAKNIYFNSLFLLIIFLLFALQINGWFLYDRGLRHERIKKADYSYAK